MALDFFVNFERQSNSSLFYRIVSDSPSTFTFKLEETNTTEQQLSTVYYAESSINDGPFSSFGSDTIGTFNSQTIFDTSSPCVCSINVNLSADGMLYGSYSISGVFVSNFPVAEFIAYPSHYINEATKQLIALDGGNYNQSPGVQFYGEGHTETINLSTNGTNNQNTANWYVGNYINDISNNVSVLFTSTISPSTASVRVETTLDDESTYPISLWLTNADITTDGPFIGYDDGTGEPYFYPFFTSTLNANNEEGYRQQLKGNINVLLYPDISPSLFQTPFPSSSFSLPLDYSLQTLRGAISYPNASGILLEKFVGTKWELDAISDVGEWSVTTDLLSYILAYQFQLSYDQNAIGVVLPLYTASPNTPTTVSLSVSSYKDVKINLAPFDWLPKRVASAHKISSTVSSYPAANLYIPNYFNLVNQDALITLASVPEYPLEIKRLDIKSSHSSDVLTLTGISLVGSSGTMRFDKIGVAELSATALLRNTVSGTEQETIRVYQHMTEIVDSYESVPDEKYFQTDLTPLELTHTSQPRLSPNEWAIADNVNSIIEKLYTTIDELDQYTKLYQKKDFFYGWLGVKPPKGTMPEYVWMDLECSYSTSENIAAWMQFECDGVNNHEATWGYHECSSTHKDPTCLQKYCLEWKWKSRKYGSNNVNITWGSSKQDGEYPKKWLYEQCDIDSDLKNCPRDTWKISTLDLESFPIPSCNTNSECTFVDAEVSPETNQMVVAYRTEINLINNDYFATYVARRGIADESFSFQNIVGLTISSEGKVIVLDDTLPRVSVFRIVDNNFVLFSTWGGPGRTLNPTGFNKPQDVHVDDSNTVWIADTGNNCIKKLTIIGKPLLTITHEKLNTNPPLSVCVDSKSYVHCLTQSSVIVFDKYGNYSFEYSLPSNVVGVKKINTSYNREMVYITYYNGIIKYFRNGAISHYTIQDIQCGDGQFIKGYNSLSQDKFRNVCVTVGDKILKIPDLQKIVESKAPIPSDLNWSLNDLLIHKEEYVQPWVYLKSFHRLWDKIELMRNSLFYDLVGCKSYTKPEYMKTDLVIGQNEIVSNAVINRLSEQLWTNLSSMFDYFDPNC